jgi:O-glycosyl hydrolase
MVVQALSVNKEPDQQLKEAACSWLSLGAKRFILGA